MHLADRYSSLSSPRPMRGFLFCIRRAGAGVMTALALSASFGSAYAQPEAAVQAPPIVAAKVNPLPLFDRPGADKPAKTLVAIGFPWVVLEDKEDFYRVNVDGKEFWVDSMDVRTAPVVKTKCTLGVAGKKQPVGAIMGAGANPCAAP